MSEKLTAIDWFQFEKLMEIVYRKQGYRVERRGGANPDAGIDLTLENSDGRIAVQCKHWRTWNVGVPKVRELIGAMTDAGIRKGVLVTISGYTGEAKALAERNSIQILSQSDLLKLLDAVDAKFDPEIQALLKDTRKFCPRCESEMVFRTAKRGIGAGQNFWGCSAYPSCRFTMQVK